MGIEETLHIGPTSLVQNQAKYAGFKNELLDSMIMKIEVSFSNACDENLLMNERNELKDCYYSFRKDFKFYFQKFESSSDKAF